MSNVYTAEMAFGLMPPADTTEVAKRSKTTLLYHSKGQSTHDNVRNDDPSLVEPIC
jgi:hypothetical protein